jgi:hypothetical protein
LTFSQLSARLLGQYADRSPSRNFNISPSVPAEIAASSCDSSTAAASWACKRERVFKLNAQQLIECVQATEHAFLKKSTKTCIYAHIQKLKPQLSVQELQHQPLRACRDCESCCDSSTAAASGACTNAHINLVNKEDQAERLRGKKNHHNNLFA